MGSSQSSQAKASQDILPSTAEEWVTSNMANRRARAARRSANLPTSSSEDIKQPVDTYQNASVNASTSGSAPTASMVTPDASASVTQPDEQTLVPSSQPSQPATTQSTPAGQPVKRGPGRPRKNTQPPSHAESSSMAQANAANQSQLPTPMPSSALPYEPPNPDIPANTPEAAMDPALVATLQAAANEADGLPDQSGEPVENADAAGKRKRGPYNTTNKRQRTANGAPNVQGAVPNGPNDSNFPKDGPFTEVERSHIDRFAINFRSANEISVQYLNSVVQSKERKMDDLTRTFWSSLYMVLPNRDHKAMQRHVRRRFHNFDKRGNWEPEEDEELKNCYLEQPNAWKWIGNKLGRMPEDCRDRWRNYVICGDNRRTDHWTVEEEQELSVCVHAAIRDVKVAARQKAQEQQLAFREDQDWLSQVNFNDVSKKMGRTRSRLQCLQHWKAINERERLSKPKRRVHTIKPRAKPADSARQAKSHYNQMLPGDKYQIALDIRDAGSSSESAIPWAILVQRSTMKWTVPDWRHAWSRLKSLDPRDDFQEQMSAIVVWFEENHTGQELERKYEHTGDEVSQQPLNLDGANDADDDVAIDPVLAVEQGTPRSNQQAQAAAVAEASSVAKSKRGRKGKAYKSADRISSSSSAGSPPAQASMLNFVKRSPNNNAIGSGFEHPSDHIFARQLGAMQAPTAQMGGAVDDDSDAEGEPELPPIRNEGENDTEHFEDAHENLQAEQAAIAALRGMQDANAS